MPVHHQTKVLSSPLGTCLESEVRFRFRFYVPLLPEIMYYEAYPVGSYMFKVNNRNSSIFIVNFLSLNTSCLEFTASARAVFTCRGWCNPLHDSVNFHEMFMRPLAWNFHETISMKTVNTFLTLHLSSCDSDIVCFTFE